MHFFLILIGYTSYTIQPGDSVYGIARKFNTSINAILFTNPSIDPAYLRVGQIIRIPFGSIVPTDVSYNYEILTLNIASLQELYPFLQTQSIGKSVLSNDIYTIKIGTGTKQIYYNASIHANEWITSPLLMKFLENYCKAYIENTNIYGYPARSLYEEATLYITPMINPDGVNLVTNSLSTSSMAYLSAQDIAKKYPDIPFPSGWKANIKGTDLNLQFPAGWENAKEIKYAQGFTSPAPRDFVGNSALSEPESIAVYRFTIEHDFRLIITYHTQGEVIYWKFLDYLPEGSAYIAEQFAKVSGYELESTPYSSGFAGYKDWFIQDFNKPGYTVEAGIGENPLPISQFDTIYSDNEGILVLGMLL